MGSLGSEWGLHAGKVSWIEGGLRSVAHSAPISGKMSPWIMTTLWAE